MIYNYNNSMELTKSGLHIYYKKNSIFEIGVDEAR